MIGFSSTEFSDMEDIILLLQQLSSYFPNKKEYKQIWESFINQENVIALTMRENNKICGYGVLMIENKIRGSKMAHIEDIVIDFNKRGYGYGKLLINELCKIAKEQKCYKVSLACSENNLQFYKKCGFKVDGLSMVNYL